MYSPCDRECTRSTCDDLGFLRLLQWSINLVKQLSCAQSPFGKVLIKKKKITDFTDFTLEAKVPVLPSSRNCEDTDVKSYLSHAHKHTFTHTHTYTHNYIYILLTQLSSDTIEHISANPGFMPEPVVLPPQGDRVCVSVPPTQPPPPQPHTQAFSPSQNMHCFTAQLGGSTWPWNVASPWKTSHLCIPPCDELNEEEQSFTKESSDPRSCSTTWRSVPVLFELVHLISPQMPRTLSWEKAGADLLLLHQELLLYMMPLWKK